MSSSALTLIRPSAEYLPGYVAALQRGWSGDTVRGAAAALEDLAQIDENPQAFLALQDDPEGKGPPRKLPDGSLVPRLPGFRRWLWDGEFSGGIGLRWQKGTPELPPHVLGHIGYAVVPWKQRRGYATAALQLLLLEARVTGLPYVTLTTEPANVASQRVIEAAGGTLYEHFTQPPAFGGKPALRYRIALG